MLGQPNFRLVPHFPAPETLGLFRVGNEEEDEPSGSGSGSESGSEDEDDASRHSPRSKSAEHEPQPAAMVDEADGDDHHAMDTDPSPGVPAAPASEGPPVVNGIKRSLEEDEDYDAE